MDFYLRDYDGAQTGPHPISYLRNKASSGAIGPAHTVAAVPPGTAPTDSDFKPANHGNLTRLARTAPAATTTASGTAAPGGKASSGKGGLLRGGGLALAVLAVIGALVGATVTTSYGDEFSFPLFIAGAVEGLVLGGLLWAAGTIVEQLDTLIHKP